MAINPIEFIAAINNAIANLDEELKKNQRKEAWYEEAIAREAGREQMVWDQIQTRENRDGHAEATEEERWKIKMAHEGQEMYERLLNIWSKNFVVPLKEEISFLEQELEDYCS